MLVRLRIVTVATVVVLFDRFDISFFSLKMSVIGFIDEGDLAFSLAGSFGLLRDSLNGGIDFRDIALGLLASRSREVNSELLERYGTTKMERDLSTGVS